MSTSYYKIKFPKPLNHWRNMLKCYGILFSITVSVIWNVLFFMVFLFIVFERIFFPNYIKINFSVKITVKCDILPVHNRYNIPRPFPHLLFCIEWRLFSKSSMNMMNVISNLWRWQFFPVTEVPWSGAHIVIILEIRKSINLNESKENVSEPVKRTMRDLNLTEELGVS